MYLPPGPAADDFALWRVVHDDGDAEDLELHEVSARARGVIVNIGEAP
jgi:hypothetical protein